MPLAKINFAYVSEENQIFPQGEVSLYLERIAIVHETIIPTIYNVYSTTGTLWGAINDVTHLIDEHWIVGSTRFDPNQNQKNKLGLEINPIEDYFFAFHPSRIDGFLIKEDACYIFGFDQHFRVILSESDTEKLKSL